MSNISRPISILGKTDVIIVLYDCFSETTIFLNQDSGRIFSESPNTTQLKLSWMYSLA